VTIYGTRARTEDHYTSAVEVPADVLASGPRDGGLVVRTNTEDVWDAVDAVTRYMDRVDYRGTVTAYACETGTVLVYVTRDEDGWTEDEDYGEWEDRA